TDYYIQNNLQVTLTRISLHVTESFAIVLPRKKSITVFPYIQHHNKEQQRQQSILVLFILTYQSPFSLKLIELCFKNSTDDEDVRLNTRLLRKHTYLLKPFIIEEQDSLKTSREFVRIIVPECLPSKVFIYQTEKNERETETK